MFTNLDFLAIGKQWLPMNASFIERQQNYITGRLLYEGNLEDVFRDVWQSIATRYGLDFKDLQQVMIKLNLFRTMTETFKMLAFQKEPEIWVGEGEGAKRLEDVYSRSKALNLMKKAFVSGHAQGDGVLKVYTNSDGKPDISVISPENWIPIYNPDNLDEVIAHVVANTYEVDNTTSILGVVIDNTKRYLNVEIHYKGYYVKRLYELDKQNIIADLLEEETIKTNYDTFTVFPFNYGTPAWRDYGLSAYTDVIPLVDELIVRLSNNSKILDDHADPQLVVGRDSLDFDNSTGQWLYNRHKAVTYDKNGNAPQYLTWDGNLTSSETQIEKILDLFYMVTGTNPQLFGQDIAGNLSGEALAKILIVPIAKTREMILSLEDACEKAFNCMLSLQGIKETVDIKFEIGQFNSAEDVTNRVVQEKGAGITSLRRAVEEINPRYTAEEVEEEIKMIQEDKQSETMTNLDDLFPKDKDGKENPVDEQE